MKRNPTMGAMPGICSSVRKSAAAALAAGWLAMGGAEPSIAAPGGDCEPRWDNTIGQPGMTSEVSALAAFDDGTGPALYAGGTFPVAGGQTVHKIARWDGATWSPLGSGMDSGVGALTVFDDGSGSALYAGGSFTVAGGQTTNRVARWDGQEWSALGAGTNATVSALAVFDDGTGPALYAGGSFTTADGQPAGGIARWDGSTWSPLGSGIDGDVRALIVFDDGTGPALYAGGFFVTAGGQTVNRIARWDGEAWSGLGTGVNCCYVSALAVFDDGTGPALYAGGSFTIAGEEAGGAKANKIARWDGATWSGLGSGTSAPVFALTVFDDNTGGGPALYAGGYFSIAGGLQANRIARWDGEQWSTLDTGIGGFVQSLLVFDDGTEPALYVGGQFTSVGDLPANRIATWQRCPTEPPCAIGDLDCDGAVDFDDFTALLASWGAPGCNGALPCPADIDGDGDVDFDDFTTLLANWS